MAKRTFLVMFKLTSILYDYLVLYKTREMDYLYFAFIWSSAMAINEKSRRSGTLAYSDIMPLEITIFCISEVPS